MAHPDHAQRALTVPSADAVAQPSRAAETAVASARSPIEPQRALPPRWLALAFAGALLLCVLAYLAYAVPGRFLSSADEKAYAAAQLSLPRGTASLVHDELVVTGAAEDGNTVISVTTDFRSIDYPVIAWIASGFAPDAHVAVLWRTDVEPARVNRRVLDVDAGRVLPADVYRDPHWIGRIVGLALAVQGSIGQPLHVRGVITKPGNAWDTARDRVREWAAPEPWSGASINTVAGGADVQPLPLPVLLVAAIVVAVAVVALILRKRGRAAVATVAASTAALALAAWFVLDAKWVVNLIREADATAQRYAGKDLQEKHLASEDRDLYAFIEKARAVMPREPARVFVVADADFFRGRAAYHLYPHNVWYEPYRNAVPPA
ncbi:MAG TPA: hypothetical protein VLI21_08940, partial [Casimicrobiaceae bacterium]|nr:hypothetical protein [Casimicrobiaceae bacterium]